jgi:intracellular sulfur oxidation DsrE/DsrF family protein
MRNLIASAVLATATVFGISQAAAQGQVHKLALQIDSGNPKTMNMVLNNAENATQYFEAQGDKVKIEIVAYGPGVQIYVKGKSPVKDRIAAMSLQDPDITFSACGNTLKKLAKKMGHEVPLISEARVVPGGVVRLMELQGEGYAYIKP